MARYGMVIDTARCVGCKTCLMACKVANNLPKNVWYNRLVCRDERLGLTPYGEMPVPGSTYMTISCQHCANPPCAAVCPTGATYQAEDGCVLIDASACIGCKACIAACPYDVRTMVEDPAFYLDFPTGDGMGPEHVAGTVEKCDLCHGRVEAGGAPACMDLCPARARAWGDLDDPESEACKMAEGREMRRLFEEEGTEPSVIYLF